MWTDVQYVSSCRVNTFNYVQQHFLYITSPLFFFPPTGPAIISNLSVPAHMVAYFTEVGKAMGKVAQDIQYLFKLFVHQVNELHTSHQPKAIQTLQSLQRGPEDI